MQKKSVQEGLFPAWRVRLGKRIHEMPDFDMFEIFDFRFSEAISSMAAARSVSMADGLDAVPRV